MESELESELDSNLDHGREGSAADVFGQVGFFFIWFYPILFAVFFGYVMKGMMGGDGGKGMGAVPVVLVDEDRSERSREFIARLKKEESLSLEDTSTRKKGFKKFAVRVSPSA